MVMVYGNVTSQVDKNQSSTTTTTTTTWLRRCEIPLLSSLRPRGDAVKRKNKEVEEEEEEEEEVVVVVPSCLRWELDLTHFASCAFSFYCASRLLAHGGDLWEAVVDPSCVGGAIVSSLLFLCGSSSSSSSSFSSSSSHEQAIPLSNSKFYAFFFSFFTCDSPQNSRFSVHGSTQWLSFDSIRWNSCFPCRHLGACSFSCSFDLWPQLPCLSIARPDDLI